MVELVTYLVNELVDDKSAVNVTCEDNVIKVTVAKDDMGKIIGRQGRIAKAIRSIVKAAGQKQGVKYSVDIVDVE